jgi:O-antigen/teichoic acid export membrane protein
MTQPGRALLRQLFVVLRGTVLAQLIGVAVLPILSRIFAPEAFGHFQVYQSILAVLVIVGALRLELVLLRSDEDETPKAIQTAVFVSIALSGFLALALGAMMMVSGSLAIASLPFPPGLVLVALLVAAVTQTLTYWLIRQQQFGKIVGLKLIQASAYAIVALAVGITIPTLDGLIYADIAGRLASAALAAAWARRENVALVNFADWREQAAFAWKHRRLPLASAPGALLNAAGAAITPLMIFNFYGAAESGQFGLLDRAASLPIAMIITAVSQVYVAQFAVLLRSRDRSAITHMNQITIAVAAGAGISALIVTPMLPSLFVLVFGEAWRTAGQLGQILAPAYAVQLVAGVLNQSLLAMGDYKLQLAWDACWPLLLGGAWFIMAGISQPLDAAISVHAAIIVALGLSFVALSHWRVRKYFAAGKGSDGEGGDRGMSDDPKLGITV